MTKDNPLISEVKKTLSFLERDYGFDAPKVKETWWMGYVSYRKQSVAIGIEVDWRDVYVGIDLEWPEKGGQIRTAPLHELLTERGYKYPTVKKGKRKRMTPEQKDEWFAKAVPEYLEEQAALLRQYAEDILRG